MYIDVTPAKNALRAYGLHLGPLAYVPALLVADSHATNLLQQDALGVTTFLALVAATRFATPSERLQVWVCVVLSVGLEVFGSLVWGVYRYRWGNLPLFVPPGHGMVYLFAVRARHTPLFRRHGRAIVLVALAIAYAWAIAGLTAIPWAGGRRDVGGAALWPIFATCALTRGRRGQMYAAAFFATSLLELVGTHLGTWTWQPVAPVLRFHNGNPPSVIAGGYCVLEAAVVGVLALAARLRRRPLGSPVPVAVVATSE